jgi:hypothetical protein
VFDSAGAGLPVVSSKLVKFDGIETSLAQDTPQGADGNFAVVWNDDDPSLLFDLTYEFHLASALADFSEPSRF